MPTPRPQQVVPRNDGPLLARVLCLGNDLLADDAFGPAVARRLRELNLPSVEIVETSESGLRLLDFALDTPRLIVVDAIATGAAAPGTIHVFDQQQLPAAPSVSPHYAGLRETLAIGRILGFPVAEKATIVAVEVEDSTTVGGSMTLAVQRAVASAADIVGKLAATEFDPELACRGAEP